MTGTDPLQERWRELVTGLADTVPGDWRVQGRGWATSLVRCPDPWTVAWVGFAKSAYSDEGWYHAGVAPLVTHTFDWSSPFLLRIDEVAEFPRKVDLANPDAGELLCRFGTGPAMEKISRGTSTLMASGAEKNYARPARPRMPPHYWLMAPGWRTVLGTESPEAPAREAVEFCAEHDIAEGVTFYQTLLDTWLAEGREATVEFLKTDRHRKLTSGGLPDLPMD